MTYQAKEPLFIIIVIFLGLFLYTKLAGPIPFSVTSVQTTKQDLFRVQGSGEATEVPNTATVSFGISQQAQSVTSAQEKVNQTAKRLVDALKEIGVGKKNIKTTNYSAYPNQDFQEGNRITGYTVSQNFEVKVKPIDKLNQAIDAATQSGANMVGGISLELDEQTQKRVEEKARREAVKNAKEKAENLAKIAGMRLGRIIDVQENFGEPPIVLRGMAEKQVGGEGETSISPGQNTIRITITLSYETL